MKYTCPTCGGQFDETTAYCEDWRDPQRKFGCPHCKTFFRKSVTSRKNLKRYLAVYCSVLGAFIGVLFWRNALTFSGIVAGMGLAIIVAMIYDHFTGGAPKAYLSVIEQKSKAQT